MLLRLHNEHLRNGVRCQHRRRNRHNQERCYRHRDVHDNGGRLLQHRDTVRGFIHGCRLGYRMDHQHVNENPVV